MVNDVSVEADLTPLKISEEDVNKLIEEYMWLPRVCARTYARKVPNSDLDDLVASGNLGLVMGARKYDKSRGVKPETYLKWWVDAKISALVYENRNVHIPWNVINNQYKINKGNAEGERIVHKELYIEQFKDDRKVDSLEVKYLSSEDDKQENFHHIMYKLEKCNMTNIEKETIKMRYGFNDSREEMTYREISKATGYSKMGIWKAEQRGLLKIKQAGILLDVLDD